MSFQFPISKKLCGGPVDMDNLYHDSPVELAW